MLLHRIGICLLALGLITTATAQDRRGTFTRDPRSVRSREIDQEHVRLELRFDLDKQEIEGRAVHTLKPFQPVKSVTLDAAGMHITKVTLLASAPQTGEQSLKFEHKNQSLTIALDHEYPAGEMPKLAIAYRITKPQHGAHFVVPDPNEPDQPRMVWTQSEPEYARFWYPCIDSPSDRLTSETLITAPEKYLTLSNGTLKSKTPHKDGTQTWHWVQEKSHVPYLLSVVVGDFEALEQSWDGIPVLSYVPRGRLEEAERSFGKTPDMLKFFTRKIGYRYPWPKYAQICVDEYMWGGMEHTSATTLNLGTLHDERAHLDVSSDNLVAHELAHQWWGDLLTCKDWGELWLNESFATYFATLWTEQDEGADEALWARHREAQDYLEEDKRVRRSIVNYRYRAPEDMFDRHSYPKGGRVLHMLRFELGEDLFWKAINRYITVNQFRTVETADLRIAIEEATGQGYNWFFDQWLHHGGHPDFEVSWRWDDETNTARVQVKQTQKVDDTTPIFRTSVDLEFASAQGMTTRRIQITKADETFHFQLAERPTRVCFDPQDWVLKTLKFEKSKEELLDQLRQDQHLICRVQAAQALAALTTDEDVESALIQAAKADSFWAVRQAAIKALAKRSGADVRKALAQIAMTDGKSFVRREAINALGNFAHDETRTTLRNVIRSDRSYYAIAEALKALLKVDRDNAEDVFLNAFNWVSHHQEIERAAGNGLVELKSTKGAAKMQELLAEKQTPERRATFIAILARLKPDDPDALQQLRDQLGNERAHVRKAVMDAFVELGNPEAISWLQEQRGKEETGGMLRAVDTAIEKLRNKSADLPQLRKELEALRAQNKQLEERLRKLEAGQKK